MHAITRIFGPPGWLTLFAAVFAALSGCETEPDSHLVSAPPPTTPVAVQTVTTTTAAVPAVIVAQAPPAAQMENPTPRPSSDYVWVGGFWTWNGNQYIWTAGHWEIPPRQGAQWIPPRWDQEGGSYRFYNGYWD